LVDHRSQKVGARKRGAEAEAAGDVVDVHPRRLSASDFAKGDDTGSAMAPYLGFRDCLADWWA
jgi:hypothetical protein